MNLIQKMVVWVLNVSSIFFVVFVTWILIGPMLQVSTAADDYHSKQAKKQVGIAGELDLDKSKPLHLIIALRTGCPYCQKSIPFDRMLTALGEKAKRFDVNAVYNEPLNIAKAYLRFDHLYFDHIQMTDFQTLGVLGTPTILLVDNSGDIKKEWIGLLNRLQEDDVLASLGVDPSLVRSEYQEKSSIRLVPTLDIPFVNGAEALREAHDSNVVVLDTRPRQDFAKGHLAAAVSMPFDEAQVRAQHELSKSTKILLFCQYHKACENKFAEKGVETICTADVIILNELGYSKVSLIAASLQQMRHAGAAIVSDSKVQGSITQNSGSLVVQR